MSATYRQSVHPYIRAVRAMIAHEDALFGGPEPPDGEWTMRQAVAVATGYDCLATVDGRVTAALYLGMELPQPAVLSDTHCWAALRAWRGTVDALPWEDGSHA